MSQKETIAEELKRFNQINKYVKKLITEQDVPDPNAPVPAPDAAGLPAPTPDAVPAPDAATVPDATPVPDATAAPDATPLPDTMTEPSSDDSTEEMDITDLVNMTKSIKTDLENKNNNNDTTQKMDSIFTKLTDLETKLQGMDQLIAKIDNLGVEIQNSKPKTPEEKLEMRSLDSYPFNENPQEFFNDKKEEMRASGKNEYVLTKNDVENYGKSDIQKSFNPNEEGNNDLRY